MTAPQILTFAVLGGMMLLFVWGRFRYDVTAILALLAALALGIVAEKKRSPAFPTNRHHRRIGAGQRGGRSDRG